MRMKTYIKIRDTIFGIIIMLVIIFVIGLCGNIETHYTRTATVYSSDRGIVQCKDHAGWRWQFYDNQHTYTKGQEVKLYMWNACTDGTIKDDEILKVDHEKVWGKDCFLGK